MEKSTANMEKRTGAVVVGNSAREYCVDASCDAKRRSNRSGSMEAGQQIAPDSIKLSGAFGDPAGNRTRD